MRHRSKKRARLERRLRPLREAYLEEFGKCVVCGWEPADQVHEIAKGSHRALAIAEPCTWLAVGFDCNMGRLNDYSLYPLERQLAIKWIHDRKRFDLARFNELRGRAPTAITIADIKKYIRQEMKRC